MCTDPFCWGLEDSQNQVQRPLQQNVRVPPQGHSGFILCSALQKHPKQPLPGKGPRDLPMMRCAHSLAVGPSRLLRGERATPSWRGTSCLPGIGDALQGGLAGPGHHTPVAWGDHDDGGHGFRCASVSCGSAAQEKKNAGTDW